MSQDFTDDCFASDHVVQTDMANIEKNFAALKSAFSGTASPSNSVAGMWWFDKTTNILKLRNEANSAWQSIWNFASNKPVITNLSNEITGAMIAAAIKDPVAGTYGLRRLGTTKQKACAGNDSRLGSTSDASVSQAKLKTSLITIDLGGTPQSGHADFSAAGTYGFYPQVQGGYHDSRQMTVTASISFEYGADPDTYATLLRYILQGTYHGDGSSNMCRARMRYVSASGEIHWVFIMRLLEDVVTPLKDIDTDEIIIYKKGMVMRRSQAPDHPCFGAKDISKVPHPFLSDVKYNGSGQPILPIIIEGDLIATPKVEIIVVNPNMNVVSEIETEADERDVDFLQIFAENYEIDEASNPAWPSIPVTVGLPKHVKDKKTHKKILADYRFMSSATVIEPIKKIIPKPDYIKVKTLKRK